MSQHLSSIEPLESRIAPATVSAVVVGDILKITALNPAVAAVFSLGQTGQDEFLLLDQGAPQQPFSGIKSIQVVMSEVADLATFFFQGGTSFRGNLSVNGLGGNDDVNISGSSTAGTMSVTGTGPLILDVGLNAGFRGGIKAVSNGGIAFIQGAIGSLTASGFNIVNLDPQSVVGSNVKITGTASGTTVIANGVIQGNLTFMGGDGPDTATLGGRLEGKVKLAMGEGGSQTTFTETFLGGDTIAVTGGAAPDHVDVNANSPNPFTSSYNAGLNFNLGDGNNTVEISGVARFGGAIKVKTGIGNDQFSFTNGGWVSGVVQVSLGDGDNGAVVNSGGIFQGGFRYTGGAGNDFLTLQTVDLVGASKFQVGDGSNSLNMGGVSTDNGLSYKGGPSNDTVSIAANEIRGKVALAMGDGTNTFNSPFLDIRGTFVYQGGNVGSDQVTISVPNSATGHIQVKALGGQNLAVLSSAGSLQSFSYSGGADSDTVVIGNANGGGQFLRIKAALGDGFDLAIVENLQFLSAAIDGGLGVDTIRRVAGAIGAHLVQKNFETIELI